MTDFAKRQKKKKGKGGKKRKDDPKDICNYYKEPGHWKRDYPKKANKDYVSALVQNDSLSQINLVMAVGQQLQQHFEQWVLDSSCSYHIYAYKHWFVTYEKNSYGNILMSNDDPYRFVGIAYVQLRMHDGAIKTLTKVCHVPGLKKILVSLGAMDSNGFSYQVESGVVKIIGEKSMW